MTSFLIGLNPQKNKSQLMKSIIPFRARTHEFRKTDKKERKTTKFKKKRGIGTKKMIKEKRMERSL